MQKLKQLWNSLPQNFRRVLHTAWQIALPTLTVHLLAAHSSKDIQGSFIAAGTVFLASVKAAYLQYRN